LGDGGYSTWGWRRAWDWNKNAAEGDGLALKRPRISSRVPSLSPTGTEITNNSLIGDESYGMENETGPGLQ